MPTMKDSPLPPVPQEAPKGGLFKRFTTKLHRPHAPAPPHRSFSVPSRLGSTQASTSALPDDAPKRKTTMKLPSLPKPQAPRSTRHTEFTSAEHREAALRARGLVPARYRDKTGYTLPLSEQETQMDQRFSVLMEEPSTEGSEGETEAKRIREAWLQRNVSNNVGESESDDEDDGAAGHGNTDFGPSRAPGKSQLVKKHTLPPLTESRAEHGDASSKRSSQQRSVQKPTPIALSSSPASPRSVRTSGTDSRVSEWLRQTPTATPTKPSDTDPFGGDDALDNSDADDILPTPTRASLSTSRRKEKPAPISTRGSDAGSTSPRSAASPALPPIPTSPPLNFDDPRSPRGGSIPQLSISPATSNSPERGRSASPIAVSSSTSTMPALSPTRTFSSATSESPRTPTAESMSLTGHARKLSVTSKASQSSEGATPGPSAWKARDEVKDLMTSAVAAVIVENPAEDDAKVEVLAGSRRPGKPLLTAEHAEQRRSGLFARRAELGPPPAKSAHTVASMSNLRRLSSKLALRPKSTIVVDSIGTRSSGSEDTVSPVSPARSRVVHSSTMPIPRTRKPLSPTMHDRGSILLQAGAIEDEESRRLSEMAFLDY